jgi:hypothetical protein
MTTSFVWMGSVLAGAALYAKAATVGPTGYTNSFSTLPTAADWATGSMGSSSSTYGNINALDAAVSTLEASGITSQVGSTANNPPDANTTAVWSSTGWCLQTRPTLNGATLLLARLINGSGATATTVSISYHFVSSYPVTEEIPGFRVYYSTTGASGSWINIPTLSSSVSALLSTNLSLASPWANGGALYLLWVDDNGSGGPDTVNQIDDFSIAPPPPPQTPVSILSQPQSLMRAEGESATFSVMGDGYPLPRYQWFKGTAPSLMRPTTLTPSQPWR